MKSICLAVTCLIITSVAAADTINVPAGGDIQAAINGASDGDIIQLEAGEYLPVATIDTIGKEVSIIGASDSKIGAPTSIIDGQNSIRVLQCTTGEGAGTVFENLVISNGHADKGGGMYCLSSSPTLENCRFTGNTASNYGGGMYNDNSSPTLENCTFTNNTASNYGGGMYNNSSSSPILNDCTFTNNSANFGGGMDNFISSSPTLNNCTFTGNAAIGGLGGGISIGDGTLTLENCTITGNTPDDIYALSEGGPLISASFARCVPGDFDGDGDFDADDHTAMGAALGICPGDLNGDGNIDGADLAALLGAWGACP